MIFTIFIIGVMSVAASIILFLSHKNLQKNREISRLLEILGKEKSKNWYIKEYWDEKHSQYRIMKNWAESSERELKNLKTKLDEGKYLVFTNEEWFLLDYLIRREEKEIRNYGGSQKTLEILQNLRKRMVRRHTGYEL